jgi:hypothetical protein
LAGGGALGGRGRDYVWAGLGVAAVAISGWLLGSLQDAQTVADTSATTTAASGGDTETAAATAAVPSVAPKPRCLARQRIAV